MVIKDFTLPPAYFSGSINDDGVGYKARAAYDRLSPNANMTLLEVTSSLDEAFKVGVSAIDLRNKLGETEKGIFAESGSLGSASLTTGIEDQNFKLMGKVTAIKVENEFGPVVITRGITFDTGVTLGKDGVGAYFGGVGLTLGPKVDIALPYGGFTIDIPKLWSLIFG